MISKACDAGQILPQEKPLMIVIGGPNGAGKTTAAMAVLPEALHCLEFLNADEIAKGLSPLNPSSVRIQASRLLLERSNKLINQKASFGFESTLAAATPEKLIRQAKMRGYQVVLLYFWLSSPQLAMQRVQRRVESGGHDIPEADVLRRYERSIQNLTDRYLKLADVWLIFDNSGSTLKPIAEGEKADGIQKIYNMTIWQSITQGEGS